MLALGTRARASAFRYLHTDTAHCAAEYAQSASRISVSYVQRCTQHRAPSVQTPADQQPPASPLTSPPVRGLDRTAGPQELDLGELEAWQRTGVEEPGHEAEQSRLLGLVLHREFDGSPWLRPTWLPMTMAMAPPLLPCRRRRRRHRRQPAAARSVSRRSVGHLADAASPEGLMLKRRQRGALEEAEEERGGAQQRGRGAVAGLHAERQLELEQRLPHPVRDGV